jgi:hypothetical protein
MSASTFTSAERKAFINSPTGRVEWPIVQT